MVTWISSLIDRLCCAAHLDSAKVDRLISDIPGFVAVHIDNLDQVYAESRKIAPPPKVCFLFHPIYSNTITEYSFNAGHAHSK